MGVDFSLTIPYPFSPLQTAPRIGRLLLGTGRYNSPTLLTDAIRVADPAMLTASLRRQLSGSKESGQAFWNLLRETQRPILPNTASCLTVRDAVQTACMARELFETNLIKLDVIGDEINLQPDPFGLVEAAVELVKRGFQVRPYCTEDWVLCRRLMDIGCEVLMPWAAASEPARDGATPVLCVSCVSARHRFRWSSMRVSGCRPTPVRSWSGVRWRTVEHRGVPCT
jgi:thiazole synthase ThiGH ThiG subunit